MSFLSSHFFQIWMVLLLGLSGCSSSKDDINTILNVNIINQKIAVEPGNQKLKLIHNVTLISNVLEEAEPNMDILIKGDHVENIQSTGNIDEQEVDEVIDGTGKFLLPGLADMHVHPVTTGESARNDLFLFLAHGVTTIRVMWGFNSHLKLRDSISKGQMIGPNMFVASQGFVGTQPLWPGSVETQNTQEVEELVQSYKEADFDFIKIYSGLPLNQYYALINKSREVGIVPIGHLPSGVPLSTALASSQRSIEHIGAIKNNEQGYEDIASSAIANEVWFCPTIAVANRGTSSIAQYQNDLIYQALSPEFKSWFNDPVSQPVLTNPSTYVNSLLNKLRQLQNFNAPIISGTDTGIRYVLPGKSLQEELEFYVEAGMSPKEALATSTVNAHGFLGSANAGEITIGGKADLVLLQDDPTQDITNIREIAGVFKSGYYFSDEDVSQILQALSVLNN